MAERFKFKISKLLCFKFCRSIDTSGTSGNIEPSKSHRSSFNRHVSYAYGCGLGPRSETPPPRTPTFLWESQDKWHVMMKEEEGYIETPRRKIYDGSIRNGEVFPTRNVKRRGRKKKTAGSSRVSASSSTDDREETESLIISSSRSFSTEKEHSPIIHEAPRVTTRTNKKKKTKKNPKRRQVVGVAVVKRSKDPYEDFKWSMMEMIVEKKMFHERDLEKLLCCFLSLNSTRHHESIVMAFSDIWSVLFSGRRGERCSGGVPRSSFRIKTQTSNW